MAALTHSAQVWPDRASFLRHAAKALSPACAAVAERVQDVPKRRDFALKLMLLARDGTVGTRRASLNAVRAICDSLREDVADFANRCGVASSAGRRETAADAQAVVVLVEQHTGTLVGLMWDLGALCLRSSPRSAATSRGVSSLGFFGSCSGLPPRRPSRTYTLRDPSPRSAPRTCRVVR